jgi:pyruvate/2-oxoglutarate/acetoin dehydrogenase E1 component
MRELMHDHNGLIFGQNLVDVGWVANTIPPEPQNSSYIDLPITDVAGVGLAVGSALSGRPTVFISRYHGYLWFNLAPIATYAAISKEAFQQDCWLMIRAIADDGAFGPVASGNLLSLAVQARGLTVCAPANIQDWQEVWKHFLANRSPLFISEHRNSYSLDVQPNSNSLSDSIVILSVGGTAALLTSIQTQLRNKNIDASIYNILWISPLRIPEEHRNHIFNSRLVFILDNCPQPYGIANGLISNLGIGSKSHILASRERISGYAKELRSSVGDIDEIVNYILRISNT